MAFNTGNPVGSIDPRDLIDNAPNLDVWANSADKLSHPDRLGVERKTLHGMEVEHEQAQIQRSGEFDSAQTQRADAFDADQSDRSERFDQMEGEFSADQSQRAGQFDAAQSYRASRFDNFLFSSGYEELGEYAPGIEFAAHNQYVTYEGQPYLLKPSVPVPYTTAGAWAGADFKLIGDDSLRQDLATGSARIGDISAGQVSISAQETRTPSVLSAVREVSITGAPTPVNLLAGETWGWMGGRLYSTEDGITWVDRMAFAAGQPRRLRPSSDGEVVTVTSAGAYKSSGWPSSTTTWVQKLQNSGGSADIQDWGFSGEGDNFIVSEYASGGPGAGWENSQKAWISTDAGETFTVKYDAALRYPGNYTHTHLHGVCYDIKSGLFFVSEGHSADVGIYYSADQGNTWTKIPGDKYIGAVAGGVGPAPTTLTPGLHGIVCGSDSHNQGVLLIERADRPEDMRVRWTYDLNYGAQGVQMFGHTAHMDELTGIVYIGMYTSANLGTSYYTILASDGVGGNLVWRGNLVTTVDSRVGFIALLPNRKLIWRTSGQESRQYIANLGLSGAVSQAEADPGGVLGGVRSDVAARGLSVAVGRASKASLQSVSVGVGSDAGESAVAAGLSAKAGANTVAVGAFASTLGHQNAVAIGKSALVTLTFGTAIGADANSAGGVAIGREAVGRNTSVAIGNRAAGGAGAGDGVAIGENATNGTRSVSVGSGAVTGNAAVAIGRNASASAASGNSVAIGEMASTGNVDCVAVGRNSAAPTASGTSIGSGAVTNTGGVSLGHLATSSTGAVAAGKDAAARSVGDVAIGRGANSAAGFGNAQTVVGQNASSLAAGGSAFGDGATVGVNHNESVAIGRSTATVRGGSVCVGGRDIESTKAGGRVYLRSPNGSVFYISVSDAGVIAVTAA